MRDVEATRVVVVGQGYVGLPVAIEAARSGFQVIGFDVDERKIRMLRQCRSHIEDISAADIAEVSYSGNYLATTNSDDIRGFDIAVISVPTPLRDDEPDMTYIEAAIDALCPHLRTGATVILESTTYPGTTDELVAGRIEHATGLRPEVDYCLGYSPERIDPGNPIWGLTNTPKVVSGIGSKSLDAIQWFLSLIHISEPTRPY